MKTIAWMASGVSEGDQPSWHVNLRRLTTFTSRPVSTTCTGTNTNRWSGSPEGWWTQLEIAEEIVQDAFAKVYERWSRLDQRRRLSAYCGGERGPQRAEETRSEAANRPTAVHSPQPEDRDYLLDALDHLSPRQKTVTGAAVLCRYDRERDRPGHGGTAGHSEKRHLPRTGRIAKGGRAVSDERRTPENLTGADDQALGEALGSAIGERVDAPATRPPVSSIAERAAARAKARNTQRAVVGIAASVALVAGGFAAWSALESDEPSELIVVC